MPDDDIQTIRVVLPETKVVRITVTSAPLSGTCRTIDLGIIDATSVFEAGFIELVPFFNGRIIQDVFFTPDNYVALNGSWNLHFTTPNTIIACPDLGIGDLSVNPPVIDQTGLQISSNAPNLGFGTFPTSNVRFRDCGPLCAVAHQYAARYGAWREWAANTAFAITESVFKNGSQFNVATGGVSGNSEPVWDTGSPPLDGTIQWAFQGPSPTQGKIHVFAVVADLSNVIIPRIGALEFVQQPTNVAAGGTIVPPVTVRVIDTDGNPYTMLQVFVELFILGGGTLTGGGQTSIDPVTGIATFDSLSIAEAGNGYVLRAYADYTVNLSPADSTPFNVT